MRFPLGDRTNFLPTRIAISALLAIIKREGARDMHRTVSFVFGIIFTIVLTLILWTAFLNLQPNMFNGFLNESIIKAIGLSLNNNEP